MKKWMKTVAIGAMAMAALAGAGCGNGQGGKKQVAIVQLMEHKALDESNQGFRDGLKENGYDDSKVSFIQENAQGDQSNLASIVTRLKEKKPDLVCAISTPAAQNLANEIHDIPIVGTAITDYQQSKLVDSNEKPGRNVTGVSDMSSVEAQMKLGLTLVPNAKKVGLIYSSSEINSQIQAEHMKQYCKDNHIEVMEKTVTSINDLQQVAEAFAGNVDFVYVPTDNTISAALPALIKVTDEAKIPVIGGDSNMAKNGALAGVSINYYRLGEQAGAMAAKILSGKAKPADMAIEYQKDMDMVINRKSADILGIQVPKDLADKAQMIL